MNDKVGLSGGIGDGGGFDGDIGEASGAKQILDGLFYIVAGEGLAGMDLDEGEEVGIRQGLGGGGEADLAKGVAEEAVAIGLLRRGDTGAAKPEK